MLTRPMFAPDDEPRWGADQMRQQLIAKEHFRRGNALRCLIDKVVLRRGARDQVAVRIVWRGGAVSEFQVTMPVNTLTSLSRYAEMEARVLDLAQTGIEDDMIAHTLTAEGHHSAQHGTA